MAAAAAPTDPATCAAPPVNGDGEGDGDPVTMGFVPLAPPDTLLTIKDGQGDVSEGIILLRVMVLSGMAVGQSVPHGAEMVEVCQSMDQPNVENASAIAMMRRAYLGRCANSQSERGEEELHGEFGNVKDANGL